MLTPSLSISELDRYQLDLFICSLYTYIIFYNLRVEIKHQDYQYQLVNWLVAAWESQPQIRWQPAAKPAWASQL